MLAKLLSVMVILALIVQGVSADSGINACAASPSWSLERQAQANTCMSPDALAAARAACASLAVDQVCLGAGNVLVNGEAAAGTVLGLGDVESLTGSSGSLALVSAQADLPYDAQALQLVLYGDASISLQDFVIPAATSLPEPYPTVTVKNGPANILNLRAAPNTDAEVVTTMKWNEQLPADGQNAAGDWLRVQTDKGAAWVFASLVTVTDGDVRALYVLDGESAKPTPSLTLESSGSTCAGGLLVQAVNDASVHLNVNGVPLTFSTATLVVQAQPDAALSVRVVSGSADVQSNDATVKARAGTQVNVSLEGGQVASAPVLQESYAFTMLADVPLQILSQATCVAGVGGDGSAVLYSAPGGREQGEIDASTSLTVIGQTIVDGTSWWLTDGGAWVAQDAVQTAGVCEAVPEVTPTPTRQVSQTAGSAHDQVPDGRSIWQAHTGVDNLSGVCTAPPIAQCDHLAAVTTQPDGTITWLGQEPLPYTLRPSGANTYSFNGRNQLNNANLSLTVTFTSPTTWVGTMQLVYDADSGCTHQFNYTAERIR